MKNGWTGGQYSIVRGIAGICLFAYFIALILSSLAGGSASVHLVVPVLAVAAVASLFFAAGWFDRIAAVAIWFSLVLFFHGWTGLLLLWHVFLPPAPFLSIAARGRVDPRGGWSISPAMFVAACVALAIAFVLGQPWIAAMLLLLLFVPRLVPRRAPDTTDQVFYDGTCGLCHSGMRWLVAEDPTGTSFRYAPLFGEAFAAAFPDAKDLPDSVIVKTAGGAVLVRSDAAIHLLVRLGGLWRIFGMVYGVLPRRVRDAMYDFVARTRYRIFGRKKDACPLMPPDLRSRFTV